MSDKKTCYFYLLQQSHEGNLGKPEVEPAAESCPMITFDLCHEMGLITQGQSVDYMTENVIAVRGARQNKVSVLPGGRIETAFTLSQLMISTVRATLIDVC